MTTVANEVNSNYTWFSEKFKEQVGVNFNDYLKNYRIEQAKALLEKANLSRVRSFGKSRLQGRKIFHEDFPRGKRNEPRKMDATPRKK